MWVVHHLEDEKSSGVTTEGIWHCSPSYPCQYIEIKREGDLNWGGETGTGPWLVTGINSKPESQSFYNDSGWGGVKSPAGDKSGRDPPRGRVFLDVMKHPGPNPVSTSKRSAGGAEGPNATTASGAAKTKCFLYRIFLFLQSFRWR